MEIDKIQSAIQLILASGDSYSKKDAEIVMSSLETENKVIFDIAKKLLMLGNENFNYDLSEIRKKAQKERQNILKKYNIEPF